MSSALRSAYRSLARHRLFAALNIGGLALGIAVFLVLYLFVRFETGYDRTLPGWEKVWKVERTIQFPGNPQFEIPSAPTLLGELRAAFPGLGGARLASYDRATVLSGNQSSSVKLALVDPAYFRLFPFAVIEGDVARTLARPDGVVVTRAIAATYFGQASPVGRTLTVAIDGKPAAYRVGAVIADLPANTTYVGDIFAALPADPSSETLAAAYGVTTFLTLTDGASARRIAAYIGAHPDFRMSPEGRKVLTERIVPLATVHLADPRTRIVVTVLGVVGVVALLLAMVNYVNLATARAGLRAREIAVRKVVGATRPALIRQLLGEALVAVTLAALTGLALAELALPFINAAGGTTLSIAYTGSDTVLLPIGLLVVAVTLLAGFHPAFVISRFQPAGVLASAQTPGGDRGSALLRKGLVTIQFGIASALMIGTFVLVAQTRHVERGDVGFGRDGLVMMIGYGDPALDRDQRARLAAAIRAVPGVTDLTSSGAVPGGGSFSISKMQRSGALGEPPMIVQGTVGPRFFETYRARLLAGRLFAPARFALDTGNTGKEPKGRTPNVVLNRAAALRLGFDSPADAIGQTVMRDDGEVRGAVRIVGVVADMRFGTPQQPVEAFAYGYYPDGGQRSVLVARTTGDPPRVLAAIDAAWHRIAPTVPSGATTVEAELYKSFYRRDAERSRLFTIGAVLAVAIGCLGLYGLAAFDTARRVREIGIRKVLGASTAEIVRLLLAGFLRPVLLANLLAWPIAWVAMSRWLAGFDDRIALSPLYFVAASLVALAVDAATVAERAWRVARAAPAAALRQA